MTHAEDVQRGYDDKRRKDAHGSVRRVGDLLGPGAADELLVAYEEAAKRDVGFERERWPIPLLVAGLIWAGRAIVQLRATQLGVVTTVAPDPDAITDRYTRCAMALWQLFDKDPLGEESAAHTMLERLEAIVAKKLLAPTADLKTALRLGGRALALVSKHDFGEGEPFDGPHFEYCLECRANKQEGHKPDCDWGKLVAEAKALSRGG